MTDIRIDMTRLTLLRAYIILCILGGAIALTMMPVVSMEGRVSALVVCVLLVALVSLLPVKLSALGVAFTATDPLMVAALGAVGGWGLIATSIVTVLSSWVSNRVQKQPASIRRLLFNIGVHLYSAVLAAQVFTRLGGEPGMQLKDMIGPLAVASACFFLLNTISVSVAVALERSRPIHAIWREAFLWTTVSFLTGLTIAACLLFVLQHAGTWGVALAIPPCWMMVVFYRTHRARLQEHQDRIGEIEALNSDLEGKVRESTKELREALASLQTANNELTGANQRLESANRAKGEFLANMTHELRTPLNSVIGFSDLISDPSSGRLNGRQSELIEDIRSSGEHLLNLINDILDLAKHDARKMDLQRTNVDVHAVVNKSLSIIRPLAQKNNVELVAEIDELVILGLLDSRMVGGALVNLLSNAVKFTPAGGTVTVCVQEDGPTGLQITVTDTGIGIAPEDQQKIFDEFYQADGSSTRGYQGTGLGLALVMNTVQMHGGSVEVDSELGRGSTFRLRYPDCRTPVTRQDAIATMATPSKGHLPAPGETTIFILEPDSLSRTLARNVLRSRGYQVSEFETKEALDEGLDVSFPDLVLVNLDDSTVLRDWLPVVKTHARCRGVHFVGLATDAVGVSDDWIRAGGAGVIKKPIRISTFANQLIQLIGAKENVA